MDGKWKYADNIFVERLWRMIKQEEVYLREYDSPIEAMISIKKYIIFYNSKRPHQSLWYKTPWEVYIQFSFVYQSNFQNIVIVITSLAVKLDFLQLLFHKTLFFSIFVKSSIIQNIFTIKSLWLLLFSKFIIL